MRRHLRRKSDNKRFARFAGVLVVIVLVAMMIPSAVRLAGMVVLYPVQQIDRWLSQSSMVIPVLWRDKIEMQEQIVALEQQVAELSRKDVSQKRLFEENNRLRTLMRAETTERILAAVVAKPSELPYDLLQIDQGSRSGVSVGSPVYIGADSVIGLVSDVYPDHAYVTLFTTPDFLATVYLSGADVTATLEGLGGGAARVKLPQGIPLRVGDLVHVPSVQPGLYGEIAWVESEPTQPEQFGYITPKIPIASLYQVAVGQPTDTSIEDDFLQQSIDVIRQEALLVSDLVVATSTASSSEASTDTQASSTAEL